MTEILKSCPCCNLAYTRETWDLLPFCRSGRRYAGKGSERMEFRNCLCGSTIAIEAPEDLTGAGDCPSV